MGEEIGLVLAWSLFGLLICGLLLMLLILYWVTK